MEEFTKAIILRHRLAELVQAFRHENVKEIFITSNCRAAPSKSRRIGQWTTWTGHISGRKHIQLGWSCGDGTIAEYINVFTLVCEVKVHT